MFLLWQSSFQCHLPQKEAFPATYPSWGSSCPFSIALYCVHTVAKFFGSWYKIVLILRISLWEIQLLRAGQFALLVLERPKCLEHSGRIPHCRAEDTGTKCAEHLLGTYFAQPEKSHKVHSSAPLPFCRNFFCPSDFCCFPKDYQIFPVLKFCVSSGLPYLAVYWRLHNSSAVPQTFIIFPNPGVIDSPYLWLITVDQKFSPEYHLGSPLLILLLTRRSIFSDDQLTTLYLDLSLCSFCSCSSWSQYISPDQCNKDC